MLLVGHRIPPPVALERPQGSRQGAAEPSLICGVQSLHQVFFVSFLPEALCCV